VLAITTLAFAIATRSWLLPQEWAMGAGLETDRPAFGTFELDDAYRYSVFALLVLGLAALVTWRVSEGRLGRDLVAVRDNEGAARALGIPIARRRMQAFMVAGALAGLGGSVIAHSRPLITPTDFAATGSIDMVVLAVVGGITVISGVVAGALLVVGVPLLLGLDPTGTAILQSVFLVMVLFRPSGFMSFLVPLRDWWIEEFARFKGMDPSTVVVRRQPLTSPLAEKRTLAELPKAPVIDVPVLLELESVSKAYGGIRAVDGVSLRVEPGEAIAIIGPNGAGKTTLFEIASGFVRPGSGSVSFAGQDVTRVPAEVRAQRGMVRSFQNALLFPTMTIRQTITLAVSRSHAEPKPDVDDVLRITGLEPYSDTVIAQLPTGVRRVAELACSLALAPRVLLLDEPSAGIAHTEIPALAQWITQMRKDLGVTVVVIDHDMNLLRAVADRFVAMELGQVIASGTADEVASDPRVIEAFLGTSSAAVERSSGSAVGVP
jgi:ABC-type branched-subunit amino acid transport system ATPase component